eukprot:s250_g11.t1
MARLLSVCLLAVAFGCLMAPATIPAGAEAFVYKGKEYFDVFYGIEPLAWAFCGFCIVYYGAVLKNAAQKYNIPPAPVPPKVGGFVGKEVENSEPSYQDPSIKQGPY